MMTRITQWAREYGDIYSLLLGPIPVVVVSSAVAIREFMDENSAVTSGRPQFHMVNLINDPGTTMATISYSKLILYYKEGPNSSRI